MAEEIDIEWLREKYVEELLRPKEISELAEVSRRTIERRLRKHGIERNLDASTFPREALFRLYIERKLTLQHIAQSYRVDLQRLAKRVLQLGFELRERYMDKRWLEDEYQQKGRSTYEIADELGATNKVISDWLNRFGIFTKAKTEPYQDPEWLHCQHYEENKSLREIAGQQGKNLATIQYWFHKYDIPIKGDTHPGHKHRENALYRDEGILRELYEVRGMSDEQVADELGANRRNVQYWRSKYGIEARSLSDATTLRHERILALYKDKKWLESRYIVEGKSTYQLADELGVTPGTIRKWILRYGFELRDPDESYHLSHRNQLEITPYLHNMLEGELLGDGSIIRSSKWTAHYSHASKHKGYVSWLSAEFASQGMGQSGVIREALCNEGTRHASVVYQYQSLNYPELLEMRRRFYPYGKKIVPYDLVLNPTSTRQWYIGDGRLTVSSKQRPNIILYTCAFDHESLDRLLRQLNNLGLVATLQPCRNQICVWADSVQDFLDYIGPCPSQIEGLFGYKWGLKS